ncbi:MAG: glycerate kinase, partial [Deferribacterales bacterium]
MDTYEPLKKIFYVAIEASHPLNIVQNYISHLHNIMSNNRFENIFLIGFGKSSTQMAKPILSEFGDIINSGVLITKYEHREKELIWENLKIYEAGHPLPDDNGIKATKKIINLLTQTGKNLIITLISGGGSALLVSPMDGITLMEKQITTDLLLKAGADIFELNTVRKHISKVKGGRLAEMAYPSRIISLIISDVLGDKLDVIASGPTSPDTSSYEDAKKVLEKYDLIDKVPISVLNVIKKGLNGELKETPKPGEDIFKNVENNIIGSNKLSIDAAKKYAETLGFTVEIITTELIGEAKEAGKYLANIAKGYLEKQYDKPLCLLSGGETTVNVKGGGKGGRNMELALSFAKEIDGIKGLSLLSAGTDGTDGPTDAAGAIVDGNTIAEAKLQGLKPEI